jgi:hypothetical protein
MADAKTTTASKKQQRKRKPRPLPDNADCYSIQQFCRQHGISVPLFYKNESLMPRTFRIGARRLITREAAARWRSERDAANEAAE